MPDIRHDYMADYRRRAAALRDQGRHFEAMRMDREADRYAAASGISNGRTNRQ